LAGSVYEVLFRTGVIIPVALFLKAQTKWLRIGQDFETLRPFGGVGGQLGHVDHPVNGASSSLLPGC
jgi:hypothetical protein